MHLLCSKSPLRSTIDTGVRKWKSSFQVSFLSRVVSKDLASVPVVVIGENGDERGRLKTSVLWVKTRRACFTVPTTCVNKVHCVGENGCNSNTFGFGNSGTETIRDIRLLFTCVPTLVI